MSSERSENFLRSYPTVRAFLVGSFSGSVSTVLLQPLDVVKTRLQNTSSLIKRQNELFGMFSTFSKIVQQEHFRGLWRGTIPSLTRSIPGVGIYFCSLEYMKTHFLSNEIATPIESIIMGVVARTTAEVILIPFSVVKTRIESGVYSYSTIVSALKEIYRVEGFRGMTRGMLPSLFRDAPFSGLYIMFYTQAKRAVSNDMLNSTYGVPLHFSCAATASILATLLTQPPDVIKTTMQIHPDKFQGIWSIIIHIKAKYGVLGYFKGTLPRMLRRSLVAGISWTIYEKCI
ncbi:hypothetical protein JTB14_006682 [Gonioctena quinquepunctata]|nr:hypothetical protein JTB14_006682 [Gonioctena quinquepunctata]